MFGQWWPERWVGERNADPPSGSLQINRLDKPNAHPPTFLSPHRPGGGQSPFHLQFYDFLAFLLSLWNLHIQRQSTSGDVPEGSSEWLQKGRSWSRIPSITLKLDSVSMQCPKGRIYNFASSFLLPGGPFLCPTLGSPASLRQLRGSPLKWGGSCWRPSG